MNKILLSAIILSFSFLGLGCKNEMKYVLYDDSEELQGYLIFEKRNNKNLCYFDLGRNKVFEIPFANVKANGLHAPYDFFIDGDKNIMVKYVGQNHKPCLQFIELNFSYDLEQKPLVSKEIEGISINRIVDGDYTYLHRTHELYYRNIYDYKDEKLINIDTFEVRKPLPSTPRPVDFFDNNYLAFGPYGIYFYEMYENFNNDSNPFIRSANERYSAVLRKVLFRKFNDGKYTAIAIFDVENMRIIETGITSMKYDPWQSDSRKFHFFGERYIIYARYKKNALNLAKNLYSLGVHLPDIFSPVEYVIYDYMNCKEIGYVENCQLNRVLDFFPVTPGDRHQNAIVQER